MAFDFPTIGELRHSLNLQTKTQNQDSAGWDQSQDWVTDSAMWCRVLPVGSGKRWEGMQRYPDADFEITARYDASNLVNSNDRWNGTILSKTRNFKVVGVEYHPDEKPQWVRTLCEERPAR